MGKTVQTEATMDNTIALLTLNNPDAVEADLLLVVASVDVDGELRDAALNHRSVTDEALHVLLVSASSGGRARILSAVTRPDILRQWANSLDPIERALVAFNPFTPVDSIARLASDSDPHVRANSVFNPGLLTSEVALIATTDPSVDVREAAETALTTTAGWSLRQGHRWAFEQESE
jgi:hypothetical protein